MKSAWVLELTENNEKKYVDAFMVGVAPDGSLLVFEMGLDQQPVVNQGFAPGTWKKFYRSNVVMH